MNYNPYAAPQAPPPASPMTPGAGGAPQPWDVGEVLGVAWEAFKAHWVVLVLGHFVAVLLAGVPGQIPVVASVLSGVEPQSSAYWGAAASGYLVTLALNAFFQGGLLRMWVSAARGEAPSFADLFSGGPRMLPLLGTLLLLVAITMVGFLLLVVPGVILAVGLAYAPYYTVEAGLGPVGSLRASWEATKGQKGQLFLLFVVLALVAMGGLVACCVGVYASMPLAYVAMAVVYLRISGRGAPVAPPPGYGAPPGGGYGAPPGGGYGGGYGGPPGGGYGAPPGGGYGPPPGGGYGGPPGGGYGGPPGGGYGGPPGGYGGPGRAG